MTRRGQSELIAVTLLALIVAVLGFFVLYQVLKAGYMIRYTMSTGQCDFTIVSAPFNITNDIATIRPVVYISGAQPCKITEIFVLAENETLILNHTSVSIVLKPGTLYVLPGIEVNVSKTGGVAIVRVVSASGVVRNFILHLG